MGNIKRVFLIVLDSFGIGCSPDAALYGDEGSNTLHSCFETGSLQVPTMQSLGLFNIDGVDYGEAYPSPIGAFGRLTEASAGKDTTIGHWEIAGIISTEALPTYPNGFPEAVISSFEAETGYCALCNKPYSGTEVLKEFGQAHLDNPKSVIVYTSADSVFQIAAHTEVVPVDELYRICEIARGLLVDKHGVGRVIARPFNGTSGAFQRTPLRKDFSIAPPQETILDALEQKELKTIGVGKIEDIFSGHGITKSYPAKGNAAGMNQTEKLLQEDFKGLCFVNLVDFDMVFGHRNDTPGYVNALNEFDTWLGHFLPLLRDDDVLVITADHGCDPGYPGTDHTRECVPIMVFGKQIQPNRNLGTRSSFADIGKTVVEWFGIETEGAGTSLVNELVSK